MATNIIAATLQNRRGLRQDLPTLLLGEIGLCTDTSQVFIGGGIGDDPSSINAPTIRLYSSYVGIPVDGPSEADNILYINDYLSTRIVLIDLVSDTAGYPDLGTDVTFYPAEEAAWDVSNTYDLGDKVLHEQVIYVCTEDGNDKPPNALTSSGWRVEDNIKRLFASYDVGQVSLQPLDLTNLGDATNYTFRFMSPVNEFNSTHLHLPINTGDDDARIGQNLFNTRDAEHLVASINNIDSSDNTIYTSGDVIVNSLGKGVVTVLSNVEFLTTHSANYETQMPVIDRTLKEMSDPDIVRVTDHVLNGVVMNVAQTGIVFNATDTNYFSMVYSVTDVNSGLYSRYGTLSIGVLGSTSSNVDHHSEIALREEDNISVKFFTRVVGGSCELLYNYVYVTDPADPVPTPELVFSTNTRKWGSF